MHMLLKEKKHVGTLIIFSESLKLIEPAIEMVTYSALLSFFSEGDMLLKLSWCKQSAKGLCRRRPV